jgi:imidazolonepropionase-like amidohydrolase
VADLLLLDFDPTRELALLQDKRHLIAILKDGRFHKDPEAYRG